MGSVGVKFLTVPTLFIFSSTLGSKAGTKGSMLETIDRDLHRMFPKHYLFLSGNEDKDDGHGTGRPSVGAPSNDGRSDVRTP